MASLAQLQSDVAGWLNRQDFISLGLFPGWVSMTETLLAETLRARCMLTYTTQTIDRAYIPLPSDFATMASIRDAATGRELILQDEWSGSWTQAYPPPSGGFYMGPYGQVVPDAPVRAYRLDGYCIELLPHPVIPEVPDPDFQYQSLLMGYFQKPRPLLLSTDTNAILETHYDVYLFNLCKLGAMWALDDARAQQMDAAFNAAVTRADLWLQQSNYSGAPYRELMAVQF